MSRTFNDEKHEMEGSEGASEDENENVIAEDTDDEADDGGVNSRDTAADASQSDVVEGAHEQLNDIALQEPLEQGRKPAATKHKKLASSAMTAAKRKGDGSQFILPLP